MTRTHSKGHALKYIPTHPTHKHTKINASPYYYYFPPFFFFFVFFFYFIIIIIFFFFFLIIIITIFYPLLSPISSLKRLLLVTEPHVAISACVSIFCHILRMRGSRRDPEAAPVQLDVEVADALPGQHVGRQTEQALVCCVTPKHRFVGLATTKECDYVKVTFCLKKSYAENKNKQKNEK